MATHEKQLKQFNADNDGSHYQYVFFETPYSDFREQAKQEESRRNKQNYISNYVFTPCNRRVSMHIKDKTKWHYIEVPQNFRLPIIKVCITLRNVRKPAPAFPDNQTESDNYIQDKSNPYNKSESFYLLF